MLLHQLHHHYQNYLPLLPSQQYQLDVEFLVDMYILSFAFLLLLLLLLLGGGSGDAMAKIFETWGDPSLASHFLLYTFLTALILCLALMKYKQQRIGRAELLFGLAIGIPNFFSAKFLLAALNSLPAVIVYPTYSVATMLVVTLAGALFFREKLNRNQWLALVIILLALVFLNI